MCGHRHPAPASLECVWIRNDLIRATSAFAYYFAPSWILDQPCNPDVFFGFHLPTARHLVFVRRPLNGRLWRSQRQGVSLDRRSSVKHCSILLCSDIQNTGRGYGTNVASRRQYFGYNISASSSRTRQNVVFLSPQDRNLVLIKRVIAVPGDHIRISQKVVILNGVALDEKYVMHKSSEEDPYTDDSRMNQVFQVARKVMRCFHNQL